MEKYAVVGTYTTEFEAKLAEAILNEGGIATFLRAPDVYPPLDYTRGIKLLVKPEDRFAATSLLDSFEKASQQESGDQEIGDQDEHPSDID